MKKNETLMQYFEWDMPSDGLHWKRCKAKAKDLKEAGITGVWLPPAYKGMRGREDVGYGVYDIYDLGEFDQKGSVETKYGSAGEYIEAVRSLKKQGIRVYADVVLNHRMGADEWEEVKATEYAENNRGVALGEAYNVGVWTKFLFPGRGGKYNEDTWDATMFTGTDWDEIRKKRGIFLFEGKTWDGKTDREKGNFDYLMGADVDLDHPEVYARLVEWGKWYLEKVGMNGFRLDAVKHMNADFYRKWTRAMKEAFPEEDLHFIGEYWHSDLQRLLHYIEMTEGAVSLFDVPLHFNFYNASKEQGRFDMRYLLANSLAEERAHRAVTFVDNHDTQPGQSLESFVEAWFKPIAYSIILLQKAGLPCIFYGDYYGIPAKNIGPVTELPLLLKLRELYAYGEQVDYFDDANVVGFVRKGEEEMEGSGLALLCSDGAGGRKRMHLGRKFSGQVFCDCVGNQTEKVLIDANGWGEFSCDGGSVSVWVPETTYEYLRINI